MMTGLESGTFKSKRDLTDFLTVNYREEPDFETCAQMIEKNDESKMLAPRSFRCISFSRQTRTV